MELKNWNDLATRLRQYRKAVETLGGLNGLDEALGMAADGVEAFGHVPEDEQGRFLAHVHPRSFGENRPG